MSGAKPGVAASGGYNIIAENKGMVALRLSPFKVKIRLQPDFLYLNSILPGASYQ